jgi:hypothetical protein
MDTGWMAATRISLPWVTTCTYLPCARPTRKLNASLPMRKTHKLQACLPTGCRLTTRCNHYKTLHSPLNCSQTHNQIAKPV